MSDLRLVKYAGNADGSATGAVTFSDDRPNLQMGGVGEVTHKEFLTLAARGLVLEPVDDGGLADKTVKELNQLAEKRGVQISDDAKKPELVSALRADLAKSGGASPEPVATGGTMTGAGGGPTGTPTGTGSAGPTT